MSLPAIFLDPANTQTLTLQLAASLRQHILAHTIVAGSKLPSSRALAEQLAISRTTVLTAYEQLLAEGYVEGRHGSGTYVTKDLPIHMPTPSKLAPATRSVPLSDTQLFNPSLPALDLFPKRLWARVQQQSWRQNEMEIFRFHDAFGLPALRSAIADHLQSWRGVTCEAQQIIITTGSGEAVELIAQVVLKSGQSAAVEEPGYDIMHHALQNAGLHLKPVPVDQHGLDPTLLQQEAVVTVTPSRHYPLGMTLPLTRRLQLLQWAKNQDALIIEDDYDSEFRYQGQPLPALMSLDESGRVIYVGSFSKVLVSGLRLGFIVVPLRLVADFENELWRNWPRASLFLQPTLARFITDGHLASHIRKMRRIYRRRQAALLSAINDYGEGILHGSAAPSGMHLVVRFDEAVEMSDQEVSARAAKVGLNVRALSKYYLAQPCQEGLVLGYAGFDEASLVAGVKKLVAQIA